MKFTVQAADAAQHLIRIHHLWNRFRRHESADFDSVEASHDQRLNERDARLGADGRLFVLQPVARPDLDNAHLIAHAHPKISVMPGFIPGIHVFSESTF